jgi:heat-inducible transcriptional repressor
MLPGKEQRLLRTVIELYVAEGKPVSSRAVQDAGGHALSTASIRNYMASLERRGLLAKPHTSAGRVPTDAAYRVYVDELMERQPGWDEIAGRWRVAMRDETRDPSDIMMHTSRFLGEVSKNFAVVYGSLVRGSRVNRIRLVGLDAPRVLVVMNLVPEHERATILRLDRSFAQDVLDSAAAYINRAITGKTLDEAKVVLDSLVRDNVTDEGIITREISINRETIFSEPPAVELFFEERGHLLEQPELSDPKNLQLILRLLHNKEYLTSILSNRLLDGTQVTIGEENDDAALRPFSLVTAGYRMGVANGVLGIIGPTRMRYDVALSLVACVSRELRAIGEEYF